MRVRSLSFFIIVWSHFQSSDQQVDEALQNGGNAMNLMQNVASMMSMQSTGCRWPTGCQSACLQRDTTGNGCYVCKSDCSGGGSGLGSLGVSGMTQMKQQPIDISSGSDNSPGLRCGKGMEWLHCTTECLKPDVNGCFHCQCGGNSKVTSVSRPTQKQLETTFATDHPTTLQFTERNLFLQASTASYKGQTRSPTSLIIADPTSGGTKGNWANQKTAKGPTPATVSSTSTELSSTTDSSDNVDNPYLIAGGERQTAKVIDNKSIVIFTLSGVLGLCLTACTVFLCLWRTTLRRLRRNKDELYFVNKIIRQDSRAPMTANDMNEPVYMHVTSAVPEVPPRSPPMTPLTPTAPLSEILLRTVSIDSQTPVKGFLCENKHDYLELI